MVFVKARMMKMMAHAHQVDGGTPPHALVMMADGARDGKNDEDNGGESPPAHPGDGG